MVLELFELYLDIAGLGSAPKPGAGEAVKSSSDGGKHVYSRKISSATTSTFAPHIFTVAVGSIASVRITVSLWCRRRLLRANLYICLLNVPDSFLVQKAS